MGLDPGQFWKQTPATFSVVMNGRAKALRENIIISAHQIEAMARQKRLPNLDKLLDVRGKAKGTDAGIFAALERAAAKGMIKIKERTADG